MTSLIPVTCLSSLPCLPSSLQLPLLSGPGTQFCLGQAPRSALTWTMWMPVPGPGPCCLTRFPGHHPRATEGPHQETSNSGIPSHWGSPSSPAPSEQGHCCFLCLPPCHCIRSRLSMEKETATVRLTASGSPFHCLEHHILMEITYSFS